MNQETLHFLQLRVIIPVLARYDGGRSMTFAPLRHTAGPEYAPDSFLGRLQPRTRRAVFDLGIPWRYPNGEQLFLQGASSAHVVLLVNATTKITITTEDGRTILLAVRQSGDLVGEVATLDDCPRPTTATAIGDADVRLIQQPEFIAFLGLHPDANIALGQSIASKLRTNIQRCATMNGVPVRVRLARALAECVRGSDRPVRDLRRRIPLSQEELASYVGASPVSVHRSLAYLRDLGVISTGYRHIVVHDVERLLSEPL